MLENWRECKLGDVAEIIGGKRLPKGELLTTKITSHPYIRITDFDRHKINLSAIQYVTKEVQKSISRYTVNKQDIILSIVGTIGLCAKIPNELDNANLTENCVKLVFDKNEIDTNFLYYHLISPDTQELIDSLNVGSTQPKLPIYNVQKIDISLPPLQEQKAIAEILSSLDDKIDLLHRQNHTLESLAQTLFRQWFIEDANPDWEVGKLGDYMQIELGGTPQTSKSEYWDGDIAWINSGEVNKFRITKPTKYITSLGMEKSNTKLLPKGSVVIAITGATLGQVSLLEIDACANQSVIGVIPNIEFSQEFLYLWIKSNINELILNQTGGAQQHINKNDVSKMKIIKPDKKFLESIRLDSYFQKISHNMLQIQTLENLRDTLLPKLISGEVRIN